MDPLGAQKNSGGYVKTKLSNGSVLDFLVVKSVSVLDTDNPTFSLPGGVYPPAGWPYFPWLNCNFSSIDLRKKLLLSASIQSNNSGGT